MIPLFWHLALTRPGKPRASGDDPNQPSREAARVDLRKPRASGDDPVSAARRFRMDG